MGDNVNMSSIKTRFETKCECGEPLIRHQKGFKKYTCYDCKMKRIKEWQKNNVKKENNNTNPK